ncbi:MAG: triphosphoribosyl-dephospho-CoA synthase, partial [Parasporobacterium sp.]|nr:triphosphoribosyl-dephospho-CoA synthase [Parasporobacterium sp.]
NTQKGEIFSLGILCACSGRILDHEKASAEECCLLAAELCDGLCEEAFSKLSDKKILSDGEKAYLEYGCTGIRGEAQSGYRTVLSISLPVYSQFLSEGISQNDALIQTLLYLIAGTDDSNVVAKCGTEGANYAKIAAAEAIRAGGIFTSEGRSLLREMDADFSKKHISPGGCADLLAVTHFLYKVYINTDMI